MSQSACQREEKLTNAGSSLSSSARLRMEARLAEANLERIRKEEELNLQSLALIAEQELKKIESKRTLLRAEAEVDAAHIRADAASTCEEDRSSFTTPAPPLSANTKVGDYLESLVVAVPTDNGKNEAPTLAQAPMEPYLRHGSLLNPSLAEMEENLPTQEKVYQPTILNSCSMPLALTTEETALRPPPGLPFPTAFDGFVAPAPTSDSLFPFERYGHLYTPVTSRIASECQSAAVRGATTNSVEQQLNPVILAGAGHQYPSPAVISQSVRHEQSLPRLTSATSGAAPACGPAAPATMAPAYGPAAPATTAPAYGPAAPPTMAPAYGPATSATATPAFGPATLFNSFGRQHQHREIGLGDPFTMEGNRRRNDTGNVGSQSSGEFCSLNDVAKLLVRCKGSAPTSVMAKFDGNSLNYHKFIQQVEDRILSIYRDCDPGHALHFLLESTTGRAHRLISSCVMFSPERGLKEALDLLYKTFGSPQVSVQVFIDSVCNGDTISNTEISLENFYSDLVNCKIGLEASGAQNILNAVSTAEKVFMRFPHNLRESFAKMALERGFEVDVVPFDLFIEFVEQRRRLLCSRFGRLLLPPRGKSTPPTKFGQKTQTNLIHSNSGRDTPQVNVKLVPKGDELAACRCCDARNNLIFRCEVFSQKPTAERLQLVRQKRLCFNCLKGSHVVKDCPSKARCRECAGKHHSLLHSPASNTERKEEPGKRGSTITTSTSAVTSVSARSGTAGTRLQVIPVCVINNVTGVCKRRFAF